MPYMLVFMRFICTHTHFECFGINAYLVQLLVVRVFFIANLTYLVICSRCIGSAWISMGYSGLPLFLTLFAHWFAFGGKDGFPTHPIIAASLIRFWLLQVWHRVASGTCSGTNFYGPIVTMFRSCSQDAYFLNISSLFIFLMILLCGVFSFRCIHTCSLMESALPMSLTLVSR